jgi:hypothetical protein
MANRVDGQLDTNPFQGSERCAKRYVVYSLFSRDLEKEADVLRVMQPDLRGGTMRTSAHIIPRSMLFMNGTSAIMAESLTRGSMPVTMPNDSVARILL